jgi:glucosamine--fructose-6-phosphate aminotransferase (isomerizing)
MCGIVGILGKQSVANQVVEALKRLEYRGYDSAGVATLEHGRLERRRAEGKLKNLEVKLSEAPLSGVIGIGHTRWATHGKPNETNAHPHATDRLAVVHNGIIENFRELKTELEAKGVNFETETDTEVVAQLVTDEMRKGKSPSRPWPPPCRGSGARLPSASSFAGEEDLLIGARHGAPLAIGFGDGEMYLGLRRPGARALHERDRLSGGRRLGDPHPGRRRRARCQWPPVKRQRQTIQTGSFMAEKGNHRHFMAKEIYEQPEVVGRTLSHYVDFAAGRVALPLTCRSTSRT